MKMAGLEGCQRTSIAMELPSETESAVTFFLHTVQAVDAKAERRRIDAELAQVEKLIQCNRQKLQNLDFTSRAPQQVVDGARELLRTQLQKQSELKNLLQNL
jgi:valyl-tRNA synthetase